MYADLPHHETRPAVRLNMIVSVDGGTSWNGVSGALGGPADKALFSVLRSFADVVLVASATMQGEQYGPAVLAPEFQDALASTAQAPAPRIAVVSRTVPVRLELALLHGRDRRARSCSPCRPRPATIGPERRRLPM